MKLFNNHSGLRGLPCLAEGIYWATGLSRTTPFTEGRLGVNNKASPPGRHQEQAPKQRCTFSPLRSVQFSSVRGTWATHHVLTANRPSADYYCAVHVQAGVLTLSGRMLAVH